MLRSLGGLLACLGGFSPRVPPRVAAALRVLLLLLLLSPLLSLLRWHLRQWVRCASSSSASARRLDLDLCWLLLPSLLPRPNLSRAPQQRRRAEQSGEERGEEAGEGPPRPRTCPSSSSSSSARRPPHRRPPSAPLLPPTAPASAQGSSGGGRGAEGRPRRCWECLTMRQRTRNMGSQRRPMRKKSTHIESSDLLSLPPATPRPLSSPSPHLPPTVAAPSRGRWCAQGRGRG